MKSIWQPSSIRFGDNKLLSLTVEDIKHVTLDQLLNWKSTLTTLLNQALSIKGSLLEKFLYTENKINKALNIVNAAIEQRLEPICWESFPYKNMVDQINEVIKFYFKIDKFITEIGKPDEKGEINLKVNPDLTQSKLHSRTKQKTINIKYKDQFGAIKESFELSEKKLDGELFLTLTLTSFSQISLARQSIPLIQTNIEHVRVANLQYYMKTHRSQQRVYMRKIKNIFLPILAKEVPVVLIYSPKLKKEIMYIECFQKNDFVKPRAADESSFALNTDNMSTDCQNILTLLEKLKFNNVIEIWSPLEMQHSSSFGSLYGFCLSADNYQKIELYFDTLYSMRFKPNTDFMGRLKLLEAAIHIASKSNDFSEVKGINTFSSIAEVENRTNSILDNINNEVISEVPDNKKVAPVYNTTEATGFNITQIEDSYVFTR